MDILIIDNHTKHLDALIALLPEMPTIVSWNKLSPNDALGRDLIILSGGTNVPNVSDYEAFFIIQQSIVRGTSAPVIGICLGAQIIGSSFDVEFRNLGSKRAGIVTINPTSAGSELLGIRSPFDVAEAHQWSIASLPDTFDILATSSDGIELFKHHTRPIWGFQFHPEYLPTQTSGDEIFQSILHSVNP